MPVPSARHLTVMVSAWLLCDPASAQTPSASGETPAYQTVRDGAKDPSAISLAEATMSFYRSVIAQERRQRGSGVALLSSALKFDEATSRAYLNYMYVAIDDGQYQQVETLRLICSKRKELTTPAQLADALQKLHLSVLSNWDYIVSRSGSALSAADKQVADAYILGARKGMRLPTTDYAKYVAMSGKSVSELIADRCDSPR